MKKKKRRKKRKWKVASIDLCTRGEEIAERIGDTATGVSVERWRMGARGRQVLVSLSL